MAIKNPAYGMWPSDDESTGNGGIFEVVDSSVDVEKAVINRMSNLDTEEREPFPAASRFKLKNTHDGQVVVFTQDKFGNRLRWASDYTPCKKSNNSSLCDGKIPVCSPYVPGDPQKGYSSTGCKAFNTCIRSWKVKKEKRKVKC